MKWLKNVEPTIEDVLSDPPILTIMASDGTSPEIVRNLLQSVARSRSAVSAPVIAPAQSQPVPPPRPASEETC